MITPTNDVLLRARQNKNECTTEERTRSIGAKTKLESSHRHLKSPAILRLPAVPHPQSKTIRPCVSEGIEFVCNEIRQSTGDQEAFLVWVCLSDGGDKRNKSETNNGTLCRCCATAAAAMGTARHNRFHDCQPVLRTLVAPMEDSFDPFARSVGLHSGVRCICFG